MTISYFMAKWLDQLVEDSKVDLAGASILEIGPQELSVSRSAVQTIAAKRLGEAKAHRAVDTMYNGETALADAQKKFYAIFGAKSYESLDLVDARSEYKLDMNLPIKLPKKYDVVTNFGTAEHVFNVFQFFENVHGLVKPGGIALHVLPAFGDANHGFYNFHPIFFRRLAQANNYDVVDYRYVDNIAYRSFSPAGERSEEIGFSGITTDDMDNYEVVRVAAYRRLLENSISAATKFCEPALYFTVFDYNFVALRKTTDAPFAIPNQ